ncbi:MAG: hypothetical protein FOGNACKC_02832 [Anaerolineae bacterium]|nr:hypothetical protein [Anaerolineae bacterium]
MLQRDLRWPILLLLILAASLLGALVFGLQLRRSQPPQPANFLAADKGYGVTIDLTRYDDDATDRTLAAMRANGLTWLRLPVDWATVEPEPGRFNWRNLDRVIAAAAPTFKLIVVLQTPPEWARPAGSTPTTPPVNFSDFGRFAGEVAARYGDRLDFYQIWHEPNLSANWGDRYVDAAAYANLLREAALNIRAADPTAAILTAALAATTEANPLNLSELAYLDRLYQANAAGWFDVVAVQPYGLWTKPLDAPAPDQPNFRRVELLRQVMLAHNDADTPVWATAFGWVALPANWAGQPSPWSNDLPSVQTNRTAQAIDYARANWPWLGPMLAVRWDAAGLAADDPARGFALTQTPPLLDVFRAAADRQKTTTPGRYPADHLTGHYSPGWRFAGGRADIPRAAPRMLTLFFEGTRLDLRLARGLFRGYLWVKIDDQPANALPRDEQGRSYVVLYDPLAAEAEVTLARHLSPGRHTAVIEADGGWEQWAILGWSVATEPDTRTAQTGLALAALLAAASGGGLLALAIRRRSQLAPAAARLVAGTLRVTQSAQTMPAAAGLALALALAALLYLLPGWPALLLLGLLAVGLLFRPDLGLALTAFASFFYLTPINLRVASFSPVELALALTAAGTIFQLLLAQFPIQNSKFKISAFRLPPSSFDMAALALVALGLLSTLAAGQFAVALREWRTVVFDPVIFYFLIRLNFGLAAIENKRGDAPPSLRPAALVDAFVAGAVLQATIALALYFFTNRSIDAEGVHRALGLGYGSPNNLALALGRAWPLLLAVALLPGAALWRRALYAAGLALTSLALLLTFSKGALLLGLPAGLLALLLLAAFRGRRVNWLKLGGALLGAALLFGLALIPFARTERFRTTFSFEAGSTAFFRVKLWQASLQMLADHWPLGVGPDNFLYQYRTRYILPEAWQEPDLNHPHNWLLDFGTRLGVGGLVIIFWLQAVYWQVAWRLYRRQASPLLLGLMASMVIFLTHGLVDNSYFLVDLALAFFLNAGLVQSLAAESSSD